MTTDLTTVEIPAFDFSAIYYPQLLEALLNFKRANTPEFTDESAQEPLIQLYRAIACVGHLNAVLTDQVANESTLPTARLTETVRNMLRLISYEMSPATPSQADVVFELVQVLSATVPVLPEFAQIATEAVGTEPARYFEVFDEYNVDRTDELTACFRVEDNVYTDFTTLANNAGTPFTAWATPVGGSISREGDSVVFGHAQVMPGEIDLDLAVVAVGITGIWEYYTGNDRKTKPNSVTDNGSYLTMNLTSYLGTADRSGTKIRVELADSGAFEERFSYYSSGTNKVDTVGLLGQSSPSVDANEYIVGSKWEPFSDQDDQSFGLTTSGLLSYTLPQNITENWELTTLNNVEAFYARFRIISVSTPTSPQINRIRIDTGKQYIIQNAIQGRLAEEVLGSSDGSIDQQFLGAQENFINNSDEVQVDNVQWTRVANFLSSKATDRHYRVELTEDDRPTFIFGNNINGAAPAAGVNNVTVIYRYNAQDDGNVGANTITKDQTGLIYVNKLFNPRPATGWEEAEGASDTSLERAKIVGPATLRVRDVALGPDDAETLATRASKLDAEVIAITRAKAVEEGFGPKTIKLVIVPAGGALASQEQLDRVSKFFNGDKTVRPIIPKRFVANQEVIAVNYTPRVIDITANVQVRGDLSSLEVQNALIRLLQPEAVKEDAVTFEWDFGGTIPTSRLEHEIFKIDDSIVVDADITLLNGSLSDLTLTDTELPVAGTLSITIV